MAPTIEEEEGEEDAALTAIATITATTASITTALTTPTTTKKTTLKQTLHKDFSSNYFLTCLYVPYKQFSFAFVFQSVNSVRRIELN